MEQDTITELAYAAGFMDGEGNIYWAPRHNGRKSPLLTITIANANRPAISKIQDIFPGGNIYSQHSTKKDGTPGKEIFYYRIRGKKAIQMLERLLPFLIAKKEQAEAAIAFQKTIPPPGRPRKHHIKRQKTVSLRGYTAASRLGLVKTSVGGGQISLLTMQRKLW